MYYRSGKNADKEEGVQNPKRIADVLYEWSLGKVSEGVVVGREVPPPGDEVVAQPRVGDADLRGGEEELAPEEAGAGERGDEASPRFRDLESLGRYQCIQGDRSGR